MTFDMGNVRQRYPWNGLVDIDYTVAYDADETPLTLAYWLVGRRIVVEEQPGKRRATYGGHLLERIGRNPFGPWGL